MLTFNQEKNTIKNFNAQTIVLTEKVNTKKLKYIIDNFESFFEGVDESIVLEWFKADNVADEDEKLIRIEEKKRTYLTKLENYLKYTMNGEIEVSYKQTSLQKGRYFCIGSSLQTHMRGFRHTLSSDEYYDLDMSNAHPNLLYQFCLKTNIQCQNLKDYALNRDKYLKFAEELDVEGKGAQKRFMLKMLNNDEPEKAPSDKLKPLFDELKTIREILTLRNPEMKKYVIEKNEEEGKSRDGKVYNLNGKVMNHIMCSLENETLICLYNILTQNKISADVLCFDGIMIRKESYKGDIPTLLRFCEEQIKKTIGYELKLEEKPMNEGFEIDPKKYEKVNISKYECPLSKEQIKNHIESCVYGDHVEYADFFMSYYGDKIKIYESRKGDLSFYHWNEDRLLWLEESGVRFMKHLQNIKFFFENSFERLNKQLLDLKKKQAKNDTQDKEEKKKERCEYMKMKKIVDEHKNAIKKLSSTPFLKSIISYLGASDLDEDIVEKMNKSKYQLPLKDGYLIDMKTKETRLRCKTDFWAYELDVSYEEENERDEKIKDYIKSLFEDEDTEKYVEKLVSYFFSGLIKDRSFYCWYGSGRNGKSAFLNMIDNVMSKRLLKTLSESAILQKKAQSGAREDIINLKDSRLAVVNETNEGDAIDSGMIKRLTGGDAITCRGLYKSEITFTTQSKILMLSNNLLQFDVSDQAMLDRVKFIPFKKIFAHNKEGGDMIEDLTKNYKNTFFSYFIRKFDLFLNEGLTESPIMLKAKEAYLSELNDVEEYIKENFEIVSSLEYNEVENKDLYRIKPNDLYKYYSEYCAENKVKRKQKQKFNKMVLDMGVIEKKSGVKYFLLKSKGGSLNED